MSSSKPIVVQKYGGSSVADAEKIRQVAQRVVDTVQRGYRVVVVISAMGKTTDGLLQLAHSVTPDPPRRELDMLLTAGERISSALLSMAIASLGQRAVSLTGSQCGIITNNRHTDARIMEVRPYRVQDELELDQVVIIAGYQGISYKRDVTTLGRGGSDTTAVAMAAALNAEYCEICSDVDGVYTADPKVVTLPQHLSSISYAQMQELAQHGAKVLNAQAVEFARRAGIVIYARATNGSKRETRVVAEALHNTSAVGVSGMRNLVGIHGDGGTAQFSRLVQVLDSFQLTALRAQLHDGQPLIIISRDNCHDFLALREKLQQVGGMVWFEEDLEAASVVGEGLGDDPRHLTMAIAIAESNGLPLHSVDIAPLRITIFLRPGRLEEAVRLLHTAFIEEPSKSSETIPTAD